MRNLLAFLLVGAACACSNETASPSAAGGMGGTAGSEQGFEGLWRDTFGDEATQNAYQPWALVSNRQNELYDAMVLLMKAYASHGYEECNSPLGNGFEMLWKEAMQVL